MKIGFIGTGNMGSAMAIAASKKIPGKDIYLSNRTRAKAEKLAKELDAVVTDNKGVAKECDFIYLCVKPVFMMDVFNEINETLKERKDAFVLVSMMAGHDIKGLQRMAEGNYPVIHMSPNTPAAIGQGMTFYCMSDNVTAENEKDFLDQMEASGRLDKIEERLMEAAGSLAGTGPAWTAMFIEGLADGAVLCGLPRKQAYEYAAMMLKGSAELFLEKQLSPSEMKDAVCSPGGTTIEGVKALEEGGLRAACMNAVIASYEKNLKLKK